VLVGMGVEYYWDFYNETRFGRYLTQVESEFILPIAARADVHRILDLGGGSGRLSLFFRRMGKEVILLEKSVEAISAGGKAMLEGIQYVRSDANLGICLKDQVVDCVISIQFMSYFAADQRQFLFSEVSRVTRRGGYFQFNFINQRSYKSKLKRLLNLRPTVSSFSASLSAILVELQGTWDVEEIRGYNYLPYRRSSNNVLIPLCGILETSLRLRERVSVAPWILVRARRRFD
jgi:ubiquinone/menaquinone biosynthesis C-methylase UbiE